MDILRLSLTELMPRAFQINDKLRKNYSEDRGGVGGQSQTYYDLRVVSSMYIVVRKTAGLCSAFDSELLYITAAVLS